MLYCLHLLEQVAQANADMNIDQLFKGDVEKSKTMEKNLFRWNIRRKVMTAAERKIVSQVVVISNSRRLKVVEASLFGPIALLTVDSGAARPVMGSCSFYHLHLQPRGTNRKIKMAGRSGAIALAKVGKVPITVRCMTHVLIFWSCGTHHVACTSNDLQLKLCEIH